MPIDAINLSYTYLIKTPFAHAAVCDIALHIDDGEFLGIIGQTGSGKSTLIQLLAGLLTPTSGSVQIDGMDIFERGFDKKELRRRLGVVFQYPEHQLFEETVSKDIAFGPQKLGLEDVDGAVRSAMELVGLDYERYAELSPFELSGGQKRKVAIAGVLAMRPKHLILDEPIAGLDPVGREEFMGLVAKLNREGTTILMISHNMQDLAEYASRIFAMKDGRAGFDGTPEEAFSTPGRMEALGLELPEAARCAMLLRERGIPIPQGVIRKRELALTLKKLLEGGA